MDKSDVKEIAMEVIIEIQEWHFVRKVNAKKDTII